jgi:aerobic-type carbon monoxide dehydrogenase small subunit (CoxS/CutS family)
LPALTLDINGKKQTVQVDDELTPLLWVLRDNLNLTGTKYGCGIAQCGVCTVHINGVATKSCVTPASSAVGKKIVTIEALAPGRSHPLQQAWIHEEVPQCGYCQSGMIMAAAALLKKKPNPTDAEIDEELSHNICRCGTYERIRKAVRRAASMKPVPAAPAKTPARTPAKPVGGRKSAPARKGGAK